MMQFGLIGLGAGAAAALLFASVSSGSWLSVVLVYLTPLPIMIAGIGWSHWTALIAVSAASLALSLAFGLMFGLAFLAIGGLPGWWLGYLAMLARPTVGSGGVETLEWYPVGRLVLWAAVLATLLVVTFIPAFGTDADSFRATLHDTFAEMLRLMTNTPADKPLVIPGVADSEKLIRAFVVALPPTIAVAATLNNLITLWLAGRVVNLSGQLKRPWPRISAMSFPKLAVAALLVAIGASFVSGLAGIVAAVLSAALLIAFGVLGFAVLHDLTRGKNGRPFMLGSTYAAVLLFQGWLMLLISVLGLAETVFDLRARIARRRGPPPLPT